MNTAAEVLVIIVSVVLTLFLVIAIVLIVQVLHLVKELREVVSHAEKVITSAASIGDIFRKSAGPVSLINFVRTVAETVTEHKHKGEKK
jgi:biopolymer transport protein ExbB/TolQ